MVGLTRRGFLGVSAAVLLAGCGVDEAAEEPPSDAEVLAGLLEPERAAGAAVIGSPVAELLARQDARHSSGWAPSRAYRRRRQEPTPRSTWPPGSRASRTPCSPTSPRCPSSLIPTRGSRVMQILASEAEHIAALRQGNGADPVPDAFAGFMEPA